MTECVDNIFCFVYTVIVDAKFIRCNSAATYGSEITINSSGDAVFKHVLFDITSAPVIYYKQISTDDTNTFDGTLKNTTLGLSVKTIQIANLLSALRIFN